MQIALVGMLLPPAMDFDLNGLCQFATEVFNVNTGAAVILVPGGGQSARQAGARLQAFLASIRGRPGPVAAVTHGGVTIELLRTLLGDDALPPGLLAAGIPPCAITTLDNLNPVMIASVSHLR